MGPLAIFMPDLFSSEVCHACSPKPYISFDTVWRDTDDGINCQAGSLPFFQLQLLLGGMWPSLWFHILPTLGWGTSSQLFY